MSTESDLERMLAEGAPPLAAINLTQVLRRSSRRRVAHQVAIGGATTLAVAGIGFAGITGIRSLGSSNTAGSASIATAPDRAQATSPLGNTAEGDAQRAPADKINLCGGSLAEIAPSESGLVLSTHFDQAEASADLITGTVTLTNSGSAHVFGSSATTPVITLSKDGLVLWHSNGALAAMARIIDLAPGASMTYPATFVPVTCAVEDDEADSFRDNLPHVVPGTYQVSAAIDVFRQSDENPQPSTDLVSGPSSAVNLR